MRRAVALLALALPSASAAGAVMERPDGLRGCSARAEGPGRVRFDARHDLRIGGLWFFGLRQAAAGPLQRSHGRDYSWKSGLAVHAGAPVLVRIPPEARHDIALNYAADRRGGSFDVRRVADGQFLVRVTPCPPGTKRFSGPGTVGPWTFFPGGLVVRAPGCYPLEVVRRGRPFTRKLVGLGATCPAPG